MKDCFAYFSLIFAAYFTSTAGPVGGNENNNTVDEDKGKVEIRLKGSSLPYAGRVEVRYDHGVWGTVCDMDWNLNNARVVCRQLGYESAEAAVPLAGFGAGSGAILLWNVTCSGKESSIAYCQQSSFINYKTRRLCNHSMDVGVICTPPSTVNDDDAFTVKTIVLIILASLLALSCIANVWLACYVCNKKKQKRNRDLLTVEQKYFIRNHTDQTGIQNLAMEGDSLHNEDASGVNTAGQQTQKPHIYQKLDSCKMSQSEKNSLDSVSETGKTGSAKLSETLGFTPAGSTSYQSIDSGASGNNQKLTGSGYEKLRFETRPPDIPTRAATVRNVSVDEDEGSEEIPDYVEILPDEDIAVGASSLTPQFQSKKTGVANQYEKLQPIQQPSQHGETKCSTNTERSGQGHAQWDGKEAEYIELVP